MIQYSLLLLDRQANKLMTGVIMAKQARNGSFLIPTLGRYWTKYFDQGGYFLESSGAYDIISVEIKRFLVEMGQAGNPGLVSGLSDQIEGSPSQAWWAHNSDDTSSAYITPDGEWSYFGLYVIQKEDGPEETWWEVNDTKCEPVMLYEGKTVRYLFMCGDGLYAGDIGAATARNALETIQDLIAAVKEKYLS